MEQFTNPPETNSYLSSVTDPFINENASTGQRFANYIIDTIVFYVFAWFPTVIMYAFLPIEFPNTRTVFPFEVMLLLILVVLFVVFYTFSEGVSSGRSIGKLATGTKVVKLDDSDITWKDALIRSLCRLVPFEPFSALGGSPWHDSWSNTKVIKIRK